MLGFFNKNSPADEMKRAVAAYEKVLSLKSDSHDARTLRMRMGMLCRAHLDKTFIAGAEQTAIWQEHADLALVAGKPAPDLPTPSKFQKIRAGEADIYAYLPEECVVEAFALGARYQKMELTAAKAIESMQALANQISYYDLRLKEPFQVMTFLRDELAAQEVPSLPDENLSPVPVQPNEADR
jgi:fructose-specific component phosphotransferase system IIB-like protein